MPLWCYGQTFLYTDEGEQAHTYKGPSSLDIDLWDLIGASKVSILAKLGCEFCYGKLIACIFRYES